MPSNKQPTQTQHEFLHSAILELGMTQEEFAKRINVPWNTLRRWLLSAESKGHRQMTPAPWALIQEVLEHERLKKKYQILLKKNH